MALKLIFRAVARGAQGTALDEAVAPSRLSSRIYLRESLSSHTPGVMPHRHTNEGLTIADIQVIAAAIYDRNHTCGLERRSGAAHNVGE